MWSETKCGVLSHMHMVLESWSVSPMWACLEACTHVCLLMCISLVCVRVRVCVNMHVSVPVFVLQMLQKATEGQRGTPACPPPPPPIWPRGH